MDGGDFDRLYDEGESVGLDPSTVLGTVPLPFSPGLGCSCSSQPSQGRTIDIVFPYTPSLFFISR
jgi:hypothetical protein